MNKSALKSYAPQARRDFIEMVQSRAALLGLAEEQGHLVIEPCSLQDKVAVINGVAFPSKVAQQRQQLIQRLQRDGFAATLDAIAYTWFNRLAALRYMELQDGFLTHGIRVLSSENPDSLPDILTHALALAESGDLPGLNSEQVAELKLASKDGELYKRLLVSQCNALSAAMPFLFERIDDETELLLPDNLLRSDSVVRKLVESIEEADWQQVEVIGWLYQFYISEKKDQVIGKVVKSEDIPAATQLFTPNWIVKYLVQNSVGRLWLQANPNSTLATEWAYYIQPAEQMPEVQAELDQLIHSRIVEDGDSLNPESISVLDPACGSGHILVEAYDLLKAIYLERGYRLRDIPRLILQNNLFGLDIDDRAAQMAGFALLMKARADDRRLFETPVKLNVYALQDSHHLNVEDLAQALAVGLSPKALEQQNRTLTELFDTFAQAKTFGSLIQIPPNLIAQLPALAQQLQAAMQQGDQIADGAARALWPLLLQAQTLSSSYDAVVANPPYMGSKGMNSEIKDFAKKQFPDSKSDLFAMFIERAFGWCKPSGFNSMVTMQSWMFLSSYQAMREKLLTSRTIITMAHLGAKAFSEISGEVVQTTAFVQQGEYSQGFKPVFFRLVDGVETEKEAALLAGLNRYDQTAQDDFKKIPGSPIAYWAKEKFRDLFSADKLGDVASVVEGSTTGDVNKFLKLWHEVSYPSIGFQMKSRVDASASSLKWFPYNKGGEYRKWYGNNEFVINWQGDGQDVKKFPGSFVRGEKFYFQAGVTWSKVSSGALSFRCFDEGFCFDTGGLCLFGKPTYKSHDLALLLNSKVSFAIFEFLAPTLNFTVGTVISVPVIKSSIGAMDVRDFVKIAKDDWDSYERSWDFQCPAVFPKSIGIGTIQDSWITWQNISNSNIEELQRLEQQNNSNFINAYGLQDELSPEVPESQITLARADREKDCQRLISYAIGCMMGRYSLDEPGLVYAHAGNEGFDPSRYATFPADTDGIVPISDQSWFPDDATVRVKEFLTAVWGKDTLAENLLWLADSLGRKADESPEDALRRYISGSFFKNHCQMYKKRPIYWLFSSGKHKAFEALVYLHRYNESTLARMRAEYVVPLTGKMAERIRLLSDDADKASTPVLRKKLDRDIDKLKKKLEELRLYDEKLRHFADQRIALDLDDGVKVNYGKFSDLLEGVKAITGGSADD